MAISLTLERPLPRAAQQATPEGLRVARVFKALRARADLTQEDVARRVDLTLSGYRPYEQGKRQLRIDQVATFAQALKVSTETLAAELGLAAVATHEAHVAECADLLRQLDGQPASVVETVLRWWRDSIDIAKLHATRPEQR